jgi:tetratricopeptide (TPR) repeat protein
VRRAASRWRALARILLAAGCLAGCAGRAPAPVLQVDRPEHHHQNGLLFLQKGDVESALHEFERARALDPTFAPALVGIALVRGARGDYPGAFAALAESPTPAARATAIRLLGQARPEGWLARAEAEFEAGRRLDPNEPALYFQMARAREAVQEYGKAAGLYRTVLALNRELVEEAVAGLQRVERLRLAEPRTAVGRQLAARDRLTRADAAALLAEELAGGPLSLRPASAEALAEAAGRALDLDGQPFRPQILAVVAARLRGLDAFPDRTFGAERVLTRGNLAALLEDLYVRATGDGAVRRRYRDAPSPFVDVRPEHYAFNAIILLTRLRVLEPEASGRFGLSGPVAGVDALLALRRLQEVIR